MFDAKKTIVDTECNWKDSWKEGNDIECSNEKSNMAKCVVRLVWGRNCKYRRARGQNIEVHV